MFSSNSSSFGASVYDSILRLFKTDEAQKVVKTTDQIYENLAIAHNSFEKSGGMRYAGFLDMSFLSDVAMPVIVEYLNGTLSRHEAAIKIADLWDGQLTPVSSRLRKQRMANATMAVDRYLSHLPAKAFNLQ